MTHPGSDTPSNAPGPVEALPAPRAPRCVARLAANLPTDEPLIGRATELDGLRRDFAQGARLITLWGPAGIGKTRLAREYVRKHAVDAVFCELSEARTGGEVLDAAGWGSWRVRAGEALESFFPQ